VNTVTAIFYTITGQMNEMSRRKIHNFFFFFRKYTIFFSANDQFVSEDVMFFRGTLKGSIRTSYMNVSSQTNFTHGTSQTNFTLRHRRTLHYVGKLWPIKGSKDAVFARFVKKTKKLPLGFFIRPCLRHRKYH